MTEDPVVSAEWLLKSTPPNAPNLKIFALKQQVEYDHETQDHENIGDRPVITAANLPTSIPGLTELSVSDISTAEILSALPSWPELQSLHVELNQHLDVHRVSELAVGIHSMCPALKRVKIPLLTHLLFSSLDLAQPGQYHEDGDYVLKSSTSCQSYQLAKYDAEDERKMVTLAGDGWVEHRALGLYSKSARWRNTNLGASSSIIPGCQYSRVVMSTNTDSVLLAAVKAFLDAGVVVCQGRRMGDGQLDVGGWVTARGCNHSRQPFFSIFDWEMDLEVSESLYFV